MTNAEPTVIHFRETGMTYRTAPGMFAPSAVSKRGETIELTPELIELNSDRLGVCALTLSEDEQLARWGRIYYAPGEAPDDVRPWDHDPTLADVLREREGHEAAQLPEAERRARMAEITAKYGTRPGVLSSTHYAGNVPE